MEPAARIASEASAKLPAARPSGVSGKGRGVSAQTNLQLGTPVCPISEQIGAKWADASFRVGVTARGANLFVQISSAAV